MKYKKVSREEARKIITNRAPLGKFYEVDKERFVGIDNSTGDAWVEEFTTKQECIDWLEGKGKEDEEISITKISKGDIVKTAWCPKTLVLKVEEDKALLFNGNQFVVAHGIQKEGDNVFWGQGHYYDDIPEDPFNKLKYKDSEVKKC